VIPLCLLEQPHPRLIEHGKALRNGLIRTLLWCVLGFGMLMAFQIPVVWGSCLVLFLRQYALQFLWNNAILHRL
jgi:hypothetical protein